MILLRNPLLLLLTLALSIVSCAPSEEPATLSSPEKIVEISLLAKQWEFSPSSITVKKGAIVRLTITSEDVTHGFALPDFGVNQQIKPGEAVTVEFFADKTGRFTFFCSVFCGKDHQEMIGELIVTE